MLDRVKKHFKSQKPKKTPAQRARQQAALLANVAEEQRGKLNADILDAATELGMVENIALLANSTENNFTGVNMYCDDEAVFVQAPLNPRATDIAACCGRAMEVRGDAFLARVRDNEDEFERLDFTLREVSSSAPWVKEAAAQNERKRNAESAQAAFARMQAARPENGAAASTAPPARVTELTPAEAAKEEGNAAIKRGDVAQAEAHYSNALRLDAGLTSAHNNRALARLRLGRWADAEADCDAVLAREPRNVKALLRRGAAWEKLGRADEALQDFRRAAELEPQNLEARHAIGGVLQE
ncbi:hypothetical protein WJX81_007094 [Elliptochloris bilobata]|uniref:Tetratricopeptide repeat protein n=1 Tax=Elliptochloris bilobata TaxID=381761 RepID=A0AAW1QNE0_9CHLO